MDASLRLRSVQHDKCGVIPSALFLSFRALFFVIPNAVRNPVHGCFTSLSMTSAVSFRTLFFVIPSESEESSAWMLHCAYASLSMTKATVSFRAHARNPVWMLHCACAPFSMTSAVSFRTLFFVIPSESEESSAMWMLRSVQHDKCGVIPNALFCHSERERGIQCDVDASLRLRSVQHDKCGVIPSALFCHSERSEESSAWMLHFAQHDKSGKRGCLTSLSWIGL